VLAIKRRGPKDRVERPSRENDDGAASQTLSDHVTFRVNYVAITT